MALKNLTIKSIPEALYQQLKARAAQHRRSINSEVILCLERAVQSNRVDPAGFLKKADALRSEASHPPLTDDFLRKAKSMGRP